MIPTQRKTAFSDSYVVRADGVATWLLTAMLLLVGQTAVAGPWIDPGDISLRNDIQVLADAGVIKGPVTTWPMSWGDVLAGINDIDEPADLGPGEMRALTRLRRLQKSVTQTKLRSQRARLSVASRPRSLRTFEDTPRETVEARVSTDWTGLRLSYRLSVAAVSGPDDQRSARFDGSYVGAVLGNYMLSVGQMERWWGPGWDGSLILSTNARPIPTIAIERNFSDPFESRWLNWLGPWTMSLLWGQLENNRFVSNARFFGLRVNFKPTENLEIGISRTAQWCGQGRPCDAETFVDLLLGQDNSGENTVVADEPGNQLAGVDWRWRLPGRLPLAWYGQLIGEDEAGSLPSRMIGQLGIESWVFSSRLGGMLRGHLEFADTAAEFYNNQVRYDYGYEHYIYRDGYRYRGRSIGHSMDNDGRMISAGISLDSETGDQWRGLFRIVDLNRGGTVANTRAQTSLDLVNLELGFTRVVSLGRFDIGLGVDRVDNWLTATSKTDFRAHINWQSEL